MSTAKAKTPGATWLLWGVAAAVIYLLMNGPGRTPPRHDETAQQLLPTAAELAADLGVPAGDLQPASPPVDLGRAEAAARTLGAGTLPPTTARAIQSFRHQTLGYQVTTVALSFADEAAARQVADLAPRLLSAGLGLSAEPAGPDRIHWRHASGYDGYSERRGSMLVFVGSTGSIDSGGLTRALEAMAAAAARATVPVEPSVSSTPP